MLSQRYTIAIADLKSGTERRRTVSLGAVLAVIGAVVLLPVLAALGAAFGAAWKAKGDVQALSASHRALEIETANYRAAVEALTGQIRSQQSTTSPDAGAESAGASESPRFDPPAATTVERSTPAPPAPRVRVPAPAPPVRAVASEPPLRVRTPEAPLRAPVPEPPVRVPAAESDPPVAVVAPVPPPPVNGERGADPEPDAPGRAAYAEAVARLSQTRALAEAAEAPSLASRSYRAAVELELDAQQLSKAGRLSDAVVRAVEANGRFRAAEIEARLETAARERLRLAAAAAAPPPAPARPPAAETREAPAAPAAPADAPRVESRPPVPASRPAEVENAVRQVIAQYVSGLESRSVAALKRVWPSLGGSQERAIQTEFQNARAVRALFTDPQITITGDTTTVTGFRTYNLVMHDGQRLSSLTRTTMTLRRRGEEWLIERIVHQQ
jgi:hypothetical protein